MPYAARTMGEKNVAICWALDRWMSGLSAWKGRLRLALEILELEDELEEELEDELEELEKLKELEEDVGGDVVVVEGLWTFLGLSQPNLLKPLTGRAWGAGAFAGLGGLPLFL